MYMQDIADSYHVNKLQRKRQTTPFANLFCGRCTTIIRWHKQYMTFRYVRMEESSSIVNQQYVFNNSSFN